MEPLQVAAMFMVGLIMVEVVKLATARVFKRTIETEYVTVEACSRCRAECSKNRMNGSTTMQENIKKLGESIDILRGILLVLAVKVGVEEDTLKDLASRRGIGP
jgi:hypothetical protein